MVVDDCDMAVVVQAGSHAGSFGCAAAARVPKAREIPRKKLRRKK